MWQHSTQVKLYTCILNNSEYFGARLFGGFETLIAFRVRSVRMFRASSLVLTGCSLIISLAMKNL